MAQSMNLNEECLLQFLSNPDMAQGLETIAPAESLSHELKRIYRRDRYVSFPQAILIRRPQP